MRLHLIESRSLLTDIVTLIAPLRLWKDLFLQNIISSRKRFSSLGDRLKNENPGMENTGLARRLLETLCLLSTHLEAYHAARSPLPHSLLLSHTVCKHADLTYCEPVM